MKDITCSTSVAIDASPDEVWKALTTPALIKQWFFGVDTESDWTPGSSIVHTGEWQGRSYVDKGQILQVEPGKLLVHTHWSDLSGKPDRPENYQEVAWSLEDQGEATELTVTEHNVPSEEAKQTSVEAWNMALTSLKKVVEG